MKKNEKDKDKQNKEQSKSQTKPLSIKILAAILSIVLIISLVLLVGGRLSQFNFWIILGICAIIAFFVIPRINIQK